MGTWFPLIFRTWPGWLLIPVTILVGFLAGAVWGFIPGMLKARLQVNEILSTVMMNAIALQLMNLLIRSVLMDPAGVTAGTYLAQSERLPEQVWLTRLVPQTLLHSGIIIAVVLAVVVYIFLWRTTIGYRIRAVGLNPDASRFAGINVPFLPGAFADPGGRVCRAGRRGRSDRRAAPPAGGHHQRLWLFRHRGGPVWRAAPPGHDPRLGPVWRAAGRRR